MCDLFEEFIQRTCANDVWFWLRTRARWPIFWLSSVYLTWGQSVLQDLDVNKGSGLDGIPPINLKSCASVFAKPLSLLFNRYIWQRALFPTSGRFHALLRYSRKIGVTTLKSIVTWQYYLQFQQSAICNLGPLCFIWFVNRISEIFDYVLFYADDMKHFLFVSGFQNCLKI
jgi:hypothetical protein